MKNIITIMLIIVGQSAFGQDSLSLRKFDYASTLYVGPQGVDTKQLNQQLQIHGIDQLSKTAFVVGTMHSLFRGRIGFGSSADLLRINSNSTGSTYAVLSGVGFGVHLAYYIVDRPSFTLFPTLEFHNVFLNLRVTQRSYSNNFDDVLSQPYDNVAIQYITDVVKLGVGLTSRRPIKNRPWTCPQADRYISYDIKVGYNFTVRTDHGHYNGVDLSNGPSLKYTGPYLRVGFGFGSRIRKMNWK